MSDVEKGKVGPSFDDFLKEEGIYEEVKEAAMKNVLAFLLKQEMQEKGITKVEMARQMDTSRAQLDRILDVANDNVQLSTLKKAAKVVGRKVAVSLV